MEMKFVEPNERRHRGLWNRDLNALNFGGRPDAQTFTFSPDAPFATKCIAEREVKAFEFDMRVKAFREGLNDLRTNKRLSAMSKDIDDQDQRSKEHQ